MDRQPDIQELVDQNAALQQAHLPSGIETGGQNITKEDVVNKTLFILYT